MGEERRRKMEIEGGGKGEVYVDWSSAKVVKTYGSRNHGNLSPVSRPVNRWVSSSAGRRGGWLIAWLCCRPVQRWLLAVVYCSRDGSIVRGPFERRGSIFPPLVFHMILKHGLPRTHAVGSLPPPTFSAFPYPHEPILRIILTSFLRVVLVY